MPQYRGLDGSLAGGPVSNTRSNELSQTLRDPLAAVARKVQPFALDPAKSTSADLAVLATLQTGSHIFGFDGKMLHPRLQGTAP